VTTPNVSKTPRSFRHAKIKEPPAMTTALREDDSQSHAR
jgi:hypothetical protein